MKTPTINSRILKLEVLKDTATRTSVNAVESRTTSLESDVATAQSDISTLQGDVATLTQGIQDAVSAHNTAGDSHADIRTSVNAVESRTTSLEGDISTAQSDISTLQTDVSTLQTDVSAVEGDISTLQGNVATLTQGIVDAVSTHNTAPDAHADIRTLVAGKQDSLTISDVGTALLNLSTPAAAKLPRINADASVTLIDLPSNVEEVDADFVSISYNPSGAGTSFEPSSILGLRAHYDPSVAGSCLDSTLAPLSSEGACRRWLDLTGNGRHLEETDSAYQATFKPAFVNGVAALDMGSSGRFSRSLNLGTEGYPEITIYMLRARKTSGATWGNWFTNTAAYEGPNKLNAHAPYGTGDSYFDFGNDTSYRLKPGYAALSYDHTAWHSLAFVRSRQRFMLFVNGSLESASSIQAPLTAFTNRAEIIYFGNYTAPQPANAYFGPLLMIGRALTQYEIGQLDAYYSARGYR